MSDLKYSKYLYKPKRGRKKAVIIIFSLLVLCGGVLYSIFFLDFYRIYTEIINVYRMTFNDYRFLQKNLDLGNYNVVIHESEPYLLKKPYNAQLHRYIGEAYYFISTSLTGEEKEESIERAILYLRKGIVLSSFDEVLTKSYYVLGMSYFKKGPHYYELAVEYLRRALDSGYNDLSLFEIVGYCYYKIGVYDDAISYLERAKQQTPTDVVHLFLAHSYKSKEMYTSSLKELDYLISHSSDDAILEEAYSARVWIYIQEERFDQAKQNLQKVFELNEDSAYAHYWKGIIYEKEGDMISARREWRLALRIDPKHIGAIEKLY
jgi:tetratricopeptide (TPR) repeat protein